MTNRMVDLGPVRRWTDKDGIIYAENDCIRLAWAYTDEPAKVGTLGFHGPDQICVEYIACTGEQGSEK